MASPARWEALCLFGADNTPEWTLGELLGMLRGTIRSITGDLRLCLFIDGLDEFDGDHSALVDLCKELIGSNPNVKICVASRPWEVFEKAFEQQASLRMEDLTYSDIQMYVSTELTASPDFLVLSQREPEYSDKLITNIVEKASGVFLWVRLVVTSLLAGMRHGDRVADFQKRLDLLPPELERLYDKILDSLDPFYLEHAAQLFTLVQITKEPMTLALMSFIDDETCDSLTRKASPYLTSDALSVRYETMQRRINSRTKGLLEVQRSKELQGNRRVQYLHRTVHDYMESKEVTRRLSEAMTQPFEPPLRICVGILAYIKLVPCHFWKSDRISILDEFIEQFMTFAGKIERRHRLDMVRLTDELGKCVVSVAKAISSSSSSRSPANGDSSFTHYDFATMMTESDPVSHFYRIVVHFGLLGFLENKHIDGFLVKFNVGALQLNFSLLADAFGIFGIGEHCPWYNPSLEPHVELIAAMLRLGAHSSHVCQIGTTDIAQTDLILTLCEMILTGQLRINSDNHEAWSEALQLLISYHDQYWSVNAVMAWTKTDRKAYHVVLLRHHDSFAKLRGGTLLNRLGQKPLSMPKLLGLTARRHTARIHQDRLQVLLMLKARVQQYELFTDSLGSLPISTRAKSSTGSIYTSDSNIIPIAYYPARQYSQYVPSGDASSQISESMV